MIRRAGFSLVEIMIACTVGVVILASAMSIYNLSNKQRGVTASARALQTAMIVEETITADIHRLVMVGAGPLKFHPDKKSRLSFYAYDPTAPKDPIGYRGVVYYLPEVPADKTPQYLQREWDATANSVGVSPLTSIAFTPLMSPTGPVVRVVLTVGRDTADPDGPPLTHTFLARIPAPSASDAIEFKALADFKDGDDKPSGQRLPKP